ncbi:MAG: hypothetical protein AB7Q42_02325 [Acidimicrobiia bacterium]
MTRTVRAGGPARVRCTVALEPLLGLVLGVVLALGLAACGTTVIEDGGTTVVTNGTTTTIELPATTSERFAEIVSLATGLGDLIADGGDENAISRIDALWAASSAEVAGDDPDLGREVEHQLGLLHTAVERNRPADADKVSRNLAEVLQTFLERHPDG